MCKANLRIDWATHAAAKYACENWHYSKSAPAGKLVKLGAWEQGKFIGVVIFGRGSNKHIASPFGVDSELAVELVRVALTLHDTKVSRILAVALRFLKVQSPKLRVVVSFADPNQGHHGGIYQAGNWVYSGVGTQDKRARPYRKHGRVFHWRTVAGELSKRGKPSTVEAAVSLGYEPLEQSPKHRYLMPLDDAMRAQIQPLSKPYPKRVKQAMAGVQPEQRRGSTDPHAPSSTTGGMP